MNKFLNIFLVFLVLISYSNGWDNLGLAEEKQKKDLQPFNKIQKFIKEQNIFKSKKKLKEEDHIDSGKSKEEVLRKLKNPFIPQLPQPESQETPIVQPTDTTGRNLTYPVPHQPVSSQHMPVPAPPKPSFSISGLVWNSDQPQAIINGQVVNVGDKVDNWTILTITEKGVEVTFQNVTYSIEP